METMAHTVAEALAQTFTIPKLEDWRKLAGMMNGYKIAEELRLDFHAWCENQTKNWRETGRWGLDVLHLRLMLFYAFRADHVTGYTYTEHDDMADSLLRAISERLNENR